MSPLNVLNCTSGPPPPILARVSRSAVVVSFADAGTWKARSERRRGRSRRCTMLERDELFAEAGAAGLRGVEARRLASAFSLLAGALLVPA